MIYYKLKMLANRHTNNVWATYINLLSYL